MLNLLRPLVRWHQGISMHHGFERLVLNQQAMDMGEKLLKRARLTRGEDLRPLLPESDIASRYERFRCPLDVGGQEVRSGEGR